MKLELTQGCIAGWLGADGIPEHEMNEQMRASHNDLKAAQKPKHIR